MRVEERVSGDIAMLSVSGDILIGGPSLMLADKVRRLLDHDCRHIVIDVGRVRYVDSGGLGALVEAFMAARNRGGTIELSGVTRRLKDLLVVTRLVVVFDCFDDEEEAIESIEHRTTVN